MARISEWDKMVSGELYFAQDQDLVRMRAETRSLLRRYNQSSEGGDRELLMGKLLGYAAENLWIEPPFYCDYGRNIKVGRNVYFNFDCVVLDVAPVTIGR